MKNIERIVAKFKSVVEELINGKPFIDFVEALKVLESVPGFTFSYIDVIED